MSPRAVSLSWATLALVSVAVLFFAELGIREGMSRPIQPTPHVAMMSSFIPSVVSTQTWTAGGCMLVRIKPMPYRPPQRGAVEAR